MRTLVYKRTHTGDPRKRGVFGIRDCMGRVRSYDFDAVIGIGGVGKTARNHGIEGKLTWVGIGPYSVGKHSDSAVPMLAFEHFILFDEDGKSLFKIATWLDKRFSHPTGPRYMLDDFSQEERKEIEKILRKAMSAPPSKGLQLYQRRARKCAPKRRVHC